jgi:hypothetical protein
MPPNFLSEAAKPAIASDEILIVEYVTIFILKHLKGDLSL